MIQSVSKHRSGQVVWSGFALFASLWIHRFMVKPNCSNFMIITAIFLCLNLSRLVTKPTMWLCAQRRLRSAWASAQSDQSLLCAQWVAKGPSFLHADSEDSDQTGRTPWLIRVFAGRTLTLLVLSRGGSFLECLQYNLWQNKHAYQYILIYTKLAFPKKNNLHWNVLWKYY